MLPMNISGLELEALRINIACQLIRLNARATVVKDLCRMKKTTTNRLFLEINQTNPVPGKLPSDPEWVIRSPKNSLHGSAFCTMYLQLQSRFARQKPQMIGRYDLFDAVIFMNSYRYYSIIAQTHRDVLDINRAWYLMNQLKQQQVEAANCNHCNRVLIVMKGCPKPYQYCPVCDCSTDCTGRSKWKEKNREIFFQRRS